MATKIQMRRDTNANFNAANTVPSIGEIIYLTDTKEVRIGDGVTRFDGLQTFQTQNMVAALIQAGIFDYAELLRPRLETIETNIAIIPQNQAQAIGVALNPLLGRLDADEFVIGVLQNKVQSLENLNAGQQLQNLNDDLAAAALRITALEQANEGGVAVIDGGGA